MKHALLASALSLALPAAAIAQDAETPETPSDVIAAAAPEDWRPVAPENLLVMTLAGGGQAYIELAPGFAPAHVGNIRRLALARWFDGGTINRVQENYVVQWGDSAEEEEDRKPLPDGVDAAPPAEYDFPVSQLIDPAPVSEGHYTAWSGYSGGWPVGWDSDGGETPAYASLVHCYGMVGVGRGDNPDTGTGEELYTVIGHAPRHLDRNIALVGRVIEGIENLSSLPRGTGDLGFYEDPAERTPIESIRLASDLAEAEQPQFEVMRTDGEIFSRYVQARANRTGWFIRPAGAVDVCNAAPPIRRAGSAD